MYKMDTLDTKKEWSCERWVQADTRGEYVNNIDLHCRAFENNKDLQNGGGVIFPIFPPHFDKKGKSFSAFSAGNRQKGVLSFWWVRATRSDGVSWRCKIGRIGHALHARTCEAISIKQLRFDWPCTRIEVKQTWFNLHHCRCTAGEWLNNIRLLIRTLQNLTP